MTFLEKLNRLHAVVRVNNKVLIAYFGPHGITLLSEDGFKLMYANKLIRGNSIADLWLKHPNRRQYLNEVAFLPRAQAPAGTLNLWQGFSVKAMAGDIQPFYDFLHDIICDGDDQISEHIFAWLAHMVQRPLEKVGTALVLHGAQGAGKSFFAQTIAALLGSHAIEICDPKHLTGSFNAHLQGKLLIVAEEAAYANKAASDRLKTLITSDKMIVEPKGVNAYETPNLLRVIITTNHMIAIFAAEDERRYIVLNVGEQRKQDYIYFAHLDSWRKGGGLEALLYYLQNLDISAVNLRCVPKTSALLDQKLLNLSPTAGWYYEKLCSGVLTEGASWEGEHPVNELYVDFIVSTGRPNDRRSQTQFGMELRKLMPAGFCKRRTAAGYRYTIPSLDRCRQSFEHWLGCSVQWPEDLAAAAE